MKKNLSIFACLAIMSTSAFAASSVDEAFKNGKVSGDISLHYQDTDNKSSDDFGFSAGSIGIVYKTGSLNGFSLEAGARANHKISEVEDNDYISEFENDAILNLANLQYENDIVSIVLGRQEIDLEWLGDFNEAVVISSSAIENLTITAGYVDRQASAGNDGSTDFAEPTEDGAYVLDAKYELSSFVLNPYFYSAPDAVDFYGIKVDFEQDMFGFTAHYAASSVDSSQDVDDGSILNLEGRLNIADFELAAGYITTDKNGGTGLMDTYGDNIDPTEEIGDAVYAEDSDTFYASIGYTIGDLGLGTSYAQSKYSSDNSKDTEWTVGAEYAITESLSADLLFVDVSADNSDDDLDKIVANITYSF